jgi:CRP-like cAMP-binding protein
VPKSNQPALSGFLNRLLLRSSLSAEEQDAILGLRSHAVQARSRQDLVQPGRTVSHACFVADGMVGRFDAMRGGERQITALHLPGDMCDLQSVLCPTAGWGLMAIGTSTVLHIPHADLLNLVMRYPAIALAFWRDTIADASVLSKWVGNVGRKDARAGLAHLFCEIAVRMEQAGLGTLKNFRLNATQEQLSEALGISAVHINRTLQALRAENLLIFRSRQVQIPDWNALALVGDFDPTYMLIDRHKEAAPSAGFSRSAPPSRGPASARQ